MKNTKTNTKRSGPGRPSYVPKLPRGKFTMTDLCEANEVNLKTGKGPKCSKLTLVKFLAKELANKRTGLVTKVKGETRKPQGDAGLGRKAFLYIRRDAPVKNNLATAAKSPVSVKVAPGTTDYEAQKAALGLGNPEPVTITQAPAEPTPAPVVAESPAPAQPEVTETAPTDPVETVQA